MEETITDFMPLYIFSIVWTITFVIQPHHVCLILSSTQQSSLQNFKASISTWNLHLQQTYTNSHHFWWLQKSTCCIKRMKPALLIRNWAYLSTVFHHLWYRTWYDFIKKYSSHTPRHYISHPHFVISPVDYIKITDEARTAAPTWNLYQVWRVSKADISKVSNWWLYFCSFLKGFNHRVTGFSCCYRLTGVFIL